MNELEHSAKGTTWGKHKYIRIENGRYIYSETDKKGNSKTRDAKADEIQSFLKRFKVTKGKSSSSKSKSSSSKKSTSDKEKTSSSKGTSEKSSTSPKSTSSKTEEKKDTTKIETNTDEQKKQQKSIDETYSDLLERMRAKANTSLLPQIRARQEEIERRKKTRK